MAIESNEIKDIQSKTQLKKQYLELTSFGRLLVDLPEEKIKKLPVDDNIKYQILKSKSMQKIALKRQTQFVGKLLRHIDLDELKEFYLALTTTTKKMSGNIHTIEVYRDKLVDPETSMQTFTKLVEDYPQIDIQVLRQQLRNYAKDSCVERKAKLYREIFQTIKAVII